MQLRNSTLAWSAIGLLAVGTATGLSAHGVLTPASPTATATTSDINPSASIPTHSPDDGAELSGDRVAQ